MPPPDLRVCFLGDSLTAGVGDDAALGWVGRLVAAARRAGTDLTGYNLGVRRETAPEVAARWPAEVPPRLRHGDGRGVVLAVGVNDTTVDGGRRRVPEPETLDAVDLVADRAGAEGWPLLVVGPTLVADAEQNRRIVALSAAMSDRCDPAGPAVRRARHRSRRRVAGRRHLQGRRPPVGPRLRPAGPEHLPRLHDLAGHPRGPSHRLTPAPPSG